MQASIASREGSQASATLLSSTAFSPQSRATTVSIVEKCPFVTPTVTQTPVVRFHQCVPPACA